MNWTDERYVRLYNRETADWRALCWQAKATLPLLIMRADRAGIVAVKPGPQRLRHIAGFIGLPLEVAEPGIADLLVDGCLVEVAAGYVFRNFIEAQEAESSDKQRKAEQRAREREKALAAETLKEAISGQVVQPADNLSAQRTESPYTAKNVTPNRAVPSVPSVPKEEERSESATSAPLPGLTNLADRRKPRETPEELQALWADEADPRLARWKESGPERRKAASNALRQRKLRDGPDSWLDVIQRVNVTPFLLGANDRGWKATLDWLLKPGRAAKVLEGNYTDAEAGATASPKALGLPNVGPSNAWQGAWCARCDGPAAYEHDAVPLCWEHLPQEARAAHA